MITMKSLTIRLLMLSLTTGVVMCTRCYDCDYDLSDASGPRLLIAQSDNASAALDQVKSRGFRQCAFIRNEDQSLASNTVCSTGTCFIRKDTNGLVYRGCADPSRLPLNVSSSINCQPQGPGQSVWWFCQGNLCNNGLFGAGDVCWEPGQPPTAAPHPPPTARTMTLKSLIGKQSNLTFEQIQAKAGYGNLRPVDYGRSGLDSKQAFHFYNNRTAAVERGHGNTSEGFGTSPGAPNYGERMEQSRPDEVKSPKTWFGQIPGFVPGTPPPGRSDSFQPPYKTWNSGVRREGDYQERFQQGQTQSQDQDQYQFQGQNQFQGQRQNLFPGQSQNQFQGKSQNQFQGQSQNQFQGQREGVAAGASSQLGIGDEGPSGAQQAQQSWWAPSPQVPDDAQTKLQSQEFSFIFNSGYKPCRSDCSNNPSGLFQYPSLPNWFIQCGPGFDSGRACQCCRPHYQQCPRETVFSSETKVCQRRSDSTSDERSAQGENGKGVQETLWNANGWSGKSIERPPIQPVDPVPPTPEAPFSGSGKSWIPPRLNPKSGPPSENEPPQQVQKPGWSQVATGGEVTDLRFILNSGYNPCDGACSDNPSGLYNHPSAGDWFVQCGPGFEGGVACQCCRPHYHQCPLGTLFSPTTKVCDEGGQQTRRVGAPDLPRYGTDGAVQSWNYIQVEASDEKNRDIAGPWIQVDGSPPSGVREWASFFASGNLGSALGGPGSAPEGSPSVFPGEKKISGPGNPLVVESKTQGQPEDDRELRFILNSGFNPCDGKCTDNPSGLFSHPSTTYWFVQCGSGFDNGVTCQCCTPH